MPKKTTSQDKEFRGNPGKRDLPPDPPIEYIPPDMPDILLPSDELGLNNIARTIWNTKADLYIATGQLNAYNADEFARLCQQEAKVDLLYRLMTEESLKQITKYVDATGQEHEKEAPSVYSKMHRDELRLLLNFKKQWFKESMEYAKYAVKKKRDEEAERITLT